MASFLSDYKKAIPMAIAFIVGIFGAFAYFFYTKPTDDILKNAIVFNTVMAAAGLGVGFINVSIIHSKNFLSKRKGWFYSLTLLIAMYFSLLIGLGASQKYYGLFTWGTDTIGAFIVNSIINPAGTAVMSLLAFYLASAAYRAFRIRGTDSAILLISGAIVLIAAAPIGAYIFGPSILDLKTWILNVPSMGGSRGTNIGLAVGSIALTIRVLFGYERSPVLGGKD